MYKSKESQETLNLVACVLFVNIHSYSAATVTVYVVARYATVANPGW